MLIGSLNVGGYSEGGTVMSRRASLERISRLFACLLIPAALASPQAAQAQPPQQAAHAPAQVAAEYQAIEQCGCCMVCGTPFRGRRPVCGCRSPHNMPMAPMYAPPQQMPPEYGPQQPQAPGGNAPQSEMPQAAPPTNAFASANAQSFAPNMIGDFFGTVGTAGSANTTIVLSGSADAINNGTGNPVLLDGSVGPQSGIFASAQTLGQIVGANSTTAFSLAPDSALNAFVHSTYGSSATLVSGQAVRIDPVSVVTSSQILVSQFIVGSPVTTTAITGTSPVNVTGTSAVMTTTTMIGPDSLVTITSGVTGTQAAISTGTSQQINNNDAYGLSYTYANAIVAANIYVPTPGAQIGRLKLAENTSPMPRDRIFFGYSYFNNVPLSATGVDVNRFSPGFEKTFFSGLTSVDFRVPVATTLSSDVFTNGTTATGRTQMGNMATTFKGLLWQNDQTFAVSGGVGLQLPTAEDTHVRAPNGAEILRVDDGSVHALPFLGYLWTPNSRFFLQGFTQLDYDTAGARVSTFDANGDRVTLGRIRDMNVMYNDIGFGYWAIQNFDSYGRMSGIAPTFELHYNKSISDGSNIQSGNVTIGSTSSNFENLNITLGLSMAMRSNTWATVAYVIPIGGGHIDRQMDGEFRFLLNRFFGPLNRLQRAQF